MAIRVPIADEKPVDTTICLDCDNRDRGKEAILERPTCLDGKSPDKDGKCPFHLHCERES